MRDKEFKNFKHIIASGDKVATRGTVIPNSDGYRPDISIQNHAGIIHLILESERKSERKAFIGAMVHAAKFATKQQTPIKLIFVMKETGNQTTVEQVSANIRPYFVWFNTLGVTCLNRVYLLSDTEYEKLAASGVELLSDQFIASCKSL